MRENNIYDGIEFWCGNIKVPGIKIVDFWDEKVKIKYFVNQIYVTQMVK